MAHHERKKGQSRERFRNIGGRHVRRDPETGERTTVLKNDTLHLTQKEADAFGDKFEMVTETPANSVTIDDDEDEEEEEPEAESEEQEEEADDDDDDEDDEEADDE